MQQERKTCKIFGGFAITNIFKENILKIKQNTLTENTTRMNKPNSYFDHSENKNKFVSS